MKRILFSILAAVIGLGLSGLCYGNDKIDKNGVVSAASVQDFYKVTVGDTLDIQVYNEKDLSGEFEIKEDGTISYPLLGSVQVKDLTKSQIENTLTNLLGSDYLVNPFVHLVIKTYKRIEVMVMGCVKSPGTFPFPENKPLTLVQAIALAEGFTAYASVNGTKIIQTGSDGKKQVIDPDIEKILSGKKKDVELEPNDLITVPERVF